MPLPPSEELKWWYQFYFATERGRAGYDKYRHDFAKLTWQIASPQWKFDDATFERSAKAFDNPDHVAVVIHNYRWRMALAESDPRYATLDAKIAAAPTIAVPTITMEGDANGAAHPAPQSYASKFTGKYEHRDLKGGIGHNLPQEAPRPSRKPSSMSHAGLRPRTPRETRVHPRNLTCSIAMCFSISMRNRHCRARLSAVSNANGDPSHTWYTLA
jgi:hypothetical protein